MTGRPARKHDTMKIDALLSPTEVTEFFDLVDKAVADGAGAIRYYSATSNVAIIGICASRGLLTWYCAPAMGNIEDVLVQSVVLAGIAAVSASVVKIQDNATNIANQAIERASKLN